MDKAQLDLTETFASDTEACRSENLARILDRYLQLALENSLDGEVER